MSVGFGKRLLSRRKECGLTQFEIAQRVGVRQQTVARWEAGSSRPRPAFVRRLAETLGEPPEIWLTEAGYSSLAEPDATVAMTPPVRPLVPVLPVHQLSPEDFERFAADFLRLKHGPAARVHRVGGPGHTQHGADIKVDMSDGHRLFIQCKRRQHFGPADVRRAVEATEGGEAGELTIWLSRTASPEARTAAETARCDIWDVEDIAREVRTASLDDARRLVGAYFPGYLGPFLGLDETRPWLTRDEFFAALLGRSGLFSHSWNLVGRDPELAELLRFAEDTEQVFGVLEGPGGSGKSRLVLEMAVRLEAQSTGPLVRFVSSAADVKPEHAVQLPRHRSVVLVVDDAHDRSDLRSIVQGATDAQESGDMAVHVLMVVRPYGRSAVESQVARAGGVVTMHVELSPMGLADTRLLAAQVLGRSQLDQLVERVAHVTQDCALTCVAACGLLNKRSIDPRLLANEDSFRSQVLEAMYRDMICAVESLPGRLDIADVMQAIAAVQPVNASDPTVLESLGRLLGCPVDLVVRALGELELAGVLGRRGRTYRVQPDLLADHVLARACFDERLRLATSYADRVLDTVTGLSRRNLLVNLCKLDWRLSADAQLGRVLPSSAWDSLESEFANGGISSRAELLRLVADVAFYQPTRALDFVLAALEQEIPDEQQPILGSLTYEHVRQQMPAVLRNVAYHLEHVDHACDLLWELAQTDQRPIHQNPDHPVRVLQDLASYSRFKPVAFTDRVVDRAIVWLAHPFAPHVSPFDILDRGLAVEGEDSAADGHRVVITSFGVSMETTRATRRRVVAAALSELSGGDVARAARAAESIAAAIRYPMGHFGREVSDAERESWPKEFKWVLHELASKLLSVTLEPTVAAILRDQLSWACRDSRPDVASAARAASAAIQTGLEVELAEALTTGLWRRKLLLNGQEWSRESAEQSLEELAAKAIDQSVDDAGTVTLLERRLAALRASLPHSSPVPGPLVAALVRRKPSIALALADRVLADPSSPALEVLGVALSMLRRSDQPASLALATRAVTTGNLDVILQAAHAYGWAFSGPELTVDELCLVRRLVGHDSALVARNVLGLVRTLATTDPQAALHLVCDMRLGRSAQLADDAFMLFSGHGPLSVAMLDDTDVRTLLDELGRLPTLEGYWIGDFLRHLSAMRPQDVASLLMSRVEKMEQAGTSDDNPLPFGWDEASPLRLAESAHYREVLTRIRDWASEDTGSWHRRWFGPRLFMAAANPLDDRALAVIAEGLECDDIARAARVASLLSEASRQLVWDRTQWVIDTLDSVASRDRELYQAVGAALHAAMMSGVRTGTPGLPFPEDVEQRDRSRALADSLPLGSPGERFFRSLQRSAEGSIRWEREADWDQ